MSRQLQKGFSMVEVIAYIALLSIIGLAVTGFVYQLVRFNARARATAQALDDARRALAVITYEVRHAQGVYDPTSSFGSNPGQLSLATTLSPPAGENGTYVDFYVDTGRLAVKRESQAAQIITSEDTQVTNLTFTQLDDGLESTPEAVRVGLTVEVEGAAIKEAVTLYATASLRSYEE